MAEDKRTTGEVRGRTGATADRTDPGVGGKTVPSRESTTLGVGTEPTLDAGTAPIVMVAPPARERTVLGVGLSGKPPLYGAPQREISAQEPPPEGWDLPEAAPAPTPSPGPAAAPEPSIAIDLTVLAPKARARAVAEASYGETPLVAAGVPRHRGLKLLFLLLLVAIGVIGYMRRDQVRPLLKQWRLVTSSTDRHPRPSLRRRGGQIAVACASDGAAFPELPRARSAARKTTYCTANASAFAPNATTDT